MKRILVVDDEYAIVEALQALLADEGYEVIVAGNGKEGLARARTDRPALCLVDVMMPVMGGRELAAALRSDPELREIPIILMSAARVPVDPGLRVNRVLRKPFALDELLESIAREIPA
jgi:CheY-like chemotaxis protein